MKVAIDSRPLISGHAVRGIGVHTRELLEEFKKIKTKDLQIDAVDFSTADLSKYDLIHYSYFHPFFLSLPLQKPAGKVVVTIHDLIPLIYPKHYPGGLKGTLKFWLQKFLIKNVDAIITISQTSKKDICRFLEVQPDKVHVVYLAQKDIFKKISASQLLNSVKKNYGLPDKFVLYVGDINYNKNIPGLIRACKIAKVTLVICGKDALDIEEGMDDLRNLTGPMDWLRFLLGAPHPELAHYEKLLGEFKNNKKVIRLGFVPDDDLVAIYNLASLYCQPSFYEGFGLSILEAMATGTPVIAAETPALFEVAKDAAIFVDPRNPKSMAKGIKNLMNDTSLQQRFISNGLRRIRSFSWEKTAKETVEVYKKVLKNEEK